METPIIAKYNVLGIAQKVGHDEMLDIVVSKVDNPVIESFENHPHLIDGIVVAVCIGGCAKVKINFQEYVIKEGTLMIVLPNYMVDPIDVSADFQIKTIVFSVDVVSAMHIISDIDVWYRVKNKACVDLTKDQFKVFSDYHSFMSVQYYRKNSPCKMDVLKSILFALISEVKVLYLIIEERNGTITRVDEMVKDFFELVYKHYKKERNIAFYANKMHLTPKYLTTAIRQNTGKSILVWINEGVVFSAKSLLKSSTKTIQEIAFELNFSDSSLFCRFFKRYTGMTPTQYRKH